MKIWSKLFLVLATGMMMFSSCLENIEPEGIKDLRGAKAELLRAKTALEEANAAKVNAEAAFVQAQAKIQEAIAKQEEAKAAYEAAVARLKELEVEKQTALDQIEIEKAIAEAQVAIAEAEALAAVYAAELERDLLNVQAEIAASQAALEVALKNLAIAKNTLTQEQQDAIASLESAVITARGEVEAKTVALEAAAKQLATMLAEVDEAKINKAVFALAEREVIKAKAYLEGKIEAEAEAKAALELDPSVTDWEAKVEAYEAEIAKLDSEWYKKDAEIDEQMAPMRDSAKVDGAIGKMVTNYETFTGYKFDENTGYFSKLNTPSLKTGAFPIGEVVVTAPVDEEGTALFGGDFNLNTANYTYGDEDVVIKKFEARLKDLSKINAKTYETNIAYYEGLIESYKENPYNKYQLAKYNDAVAAYTAGDVLPYFNKYVFPYDGTLPEDFDLTVAVKEYNDALDAMNKAVAQFNSEYDKYNPDFNAEADAAYVAKTKAYSAAEIALAKAYQKAEDDTKYTYNTNYVLPAAQGAWTAAQYAYNIAVAEAETAGTADQATMTAFVEAYDASTATEPEKELYAAYTAALKLIADAGKVKTAAEAEYNKAVEAYEKIKDTYDKAIAKADADYGVAIDKADADYEKALAAIAAKTPTFDPDYSNNLVAQVDAAETELQDAVDLIYDVKGYFGTFNSNYVEFELNSGAVYTINYIPEFMVDITVGNDGVRVYAMKSAAVADFVDKEYFKDNIVADLAENLTAVKYDYYLWYIDNLGNFDRDYVGSASWKYDSYEGYPLELPTVEEYEEYVDNTVFTTPQYIWDEFNYMINNNHYTQVLVNIPMQQSSYPSLYAEVAAEAEIADLKADIENLKKLPDFVKAIEAAQAEFEALVKENADKLAADKAEVEAFYAKYLAAEEKAADELEAIKAKNDAIKVRYNAMKSVITEYCNAKKAGTNTVDALVAALQANYEAAVADVINAEQAVINAEKAIEDLKAGVVSAADAAQRAYDRAAEELAVAISKLEKATAALENIIAAIYETGEVPETPEGGDDTTEGGEETPAE